MFGAFTSFGKLGSLARAIAAAWSPADLTALAAWYDPSDLSTMFNDSAGTTPVATPGTVADSANPVGLIQDKSGNGHHASQSTSTARPLLSARRNLLTSTEDLTASAWAAGNAVTRGVNTITATGTDNVQVAQNTGARVGEKITATFKVKKGLSFAILATDAASGGNTAGFDGTTGAYFASGSLNGLYPLVSYSCVTDTDADYWLASATFTSNVFGTSNVGVIINKNKVSSWGWSGCCDIGDVLDFGDVKQYEIGSSYSGYQRVTTGSDYDGDPAKFPYKEQFDGVDDFQVTASGGGASTAAMVCLGFTSTLAGTDQTLWTDRTGNTGLSLGISAGNAIVLSGGNGSSIVTVTGDAVTLGTPYVVTALYDGTDLSVQLNDATPVTGACTLSAGQAAITLGAATGGASGFFKGSIFEVLYVKDATTLPADVAEAKAWVAAKSGVTL